MNLSHRIQFQSRSFSTSLGSLILVCGLLLAAGCNRGDDADTNKTTPASTTNGEKSSDKSDDGTTSSPNEKETDIAQAATAQRVAVVDANRITNSFSFGTQINNQMQAVRLKYQPTLQSVASDYAEQFDKKKAEFGDKPTEEQTKELQAIVQKREEILRSVQFRLEQELAVLHQNLMSQARNIIRPAIKRVAEDRGYTLVINGDMAYSASPESDDITEAVILDIRAHNEEIKSLEPPFEDEDTKEKASGEGGE